MGIGVQLKLYVTLLVNSIGIYWMYDCVRNFFCCLLILTNCFFGSFIWSVLYHILSFLLHPILCSFGRVGASYDERRFLDERYSRDNVYPRNAFHRDVLDRESYPPPPPAIGLWPQSRRRSYEEDYPLDRESRRHEKSYVNSYHEMETFRDHEIDAIQEFDKFGDGYRSIDNYRDHEFDRPGRFGGRERDDYVYDDYDYRSRISHQSREDSRDRDYDFGRHSYDSDYERGSRRDANWRRRESRDKKGLSRERDPSPHKRHERSRSRGQDDRPRSRSPRSRSHGRSHREDSYDDDRHERTDKRREREEKRHREQYAVVCFNC